MLTTKLNNEVEMPLTGFGTAFISHADLPEVILKALSIGYRKFDTAWLYGNERVIGDTLKNCGISREQLFLTTKIHANDIYWRGDSRFSIRKKSIKTAIEQHCKRLKTNRIDLLLIHWPFRKYVELYEGVLDVMNSSSGPEIGAVGVSSWLAPHIEKIIKETGVVPAVNQFEINPYLTNDDLVNYCQNLGVHVESYSSFGSQNAKKILYNPVISRIAKYYGKTSSQVILRWLTQRGISVVPRSTSEQHLLENLEAEHFNLSTEHLNKISSLNKNEYSRYNPAYTLSWV